MFTRGVGWRLTAPPFPIRVESGLAWFPPPWVEKVGVRGSEPPIASCAGAGLPLPHHMLPGLADHAGHCGLPDGHPLWGCPAWAPREGAGHSRVTWKSQEGGWSPGRWCPGCWHLTVLRAGQRLRACLMPCACVCARVHMCLCVARVYAGACEYVCVCLCLGPCVCMTAWVCARVRECVTRLCTCV